MPTTGPNAVLKHAAWIALAVLAAVCLGTIALRRGETISALWLVTAAVSVYLIAFRFYSRYIAMHALRIDGRRATPAWRRNDGLDFVPTERSVLFGHHFAAIAGAGPLVGPVLAAQMGYLPGTLWIIVGVVFAGAVQDMLVLFFSTRRDGRSLGEMIRSEMGAAAGVIAMIGILMIMVILLAVLALVVVQGAGAESLGHLHRRDDDSDRDRDGRVPAGAPARGASSRSRCIGLVLLLLVDLDRRPRRHRPGLGAGVHAARHHARVVADRLRLRRRGAAGVAAARAARLSVDLPQDRHGRAARGRAS